MKTLITGRTKAALTIVLLAATLSACGDDGGPTGVASDLVGTWQVTRFQATGFPDFITAGMGLTLTLTENEYSLTVTNDLADICQGTTSCTTSGTYSATSSQITLDPGTTDEVTFSYNIQGSTMTWTGFIEGAPVTIEAMRIS